jgi:23S rRNA (uracil1939-C5)-methyltransferase
MEAEPAGGVDVTDGSGMADRSGATGDPGAGGGADAREGIVEVEVRALASGGDGVAELPDGRVVFVPRTAPGDVARISIEQDRSSWARGTVVELVEKGDVRVEAPCPLYDRCGGCQLQHLPYSEQLRWKGRFVVDALERIGKLSGVPELEVVPSPRVEGYRSRMTFSLRRLRGGRVVAGLHALEAPAHVVDVDDACLLPRADVLDGWTRLRSVWGNGARRLPSGGRLRLTVRGTSRGIELLIDGGAPGWRSGGLMDDVSGLVAVWHRPSGAEEPLLVAGASEPGGGNAFEQVNPEGAELLRQHVLDVVRAPGSSTHAAAGKRPSPLSDGRDEGGIAGAPSARIVEAYCGTAPVGRALAAEGHTVVGIELNASAVAAVRLDAPEGLEIVEGDVEAHLPDALPADLLLLNPPRRGLADTVPGIVLSSPPPRVVYVSCDPATLARDVKRLGDAYRLSALRSFDLFPHTAHVETVAVLERRDAAGEREAGS